MDSSREDTTPWGDLGRRRRGYINDDRVEVEPRRGRGRRRSSEEPFTTENLSSVFVLAAFSPTAPPPSLPGPPPTPLPASRDISNNSSGKSTGDGDLETHQGDRGRAPPLAVMLALAAAASLALLVADLAAAIDCRAAYEGDDAPHRRASVVHVDDGCGRVVEFPPTDDEDDDCEDDDEEVGVGVGRREFQSWTPVTSPSLAVASAKVMSPLSTRAQLAARRARIKFPLPRSGGSLPPSSARPDLGAEV